MNAILEKLFSAADTHGEDSGEPDHTVGDLQDMMRLAWDIMSVGQKLQFLRNPYLRALLQDGTGDEFSAESLAAQVLDQP